MVTHILVKTTFEQQSQIHYYGKSKVKTYDYLSIEKILTFQLICL